MDLVVRAFEREATRQDGVRSVLASLLVFLDSQPLLARVWLVESLAAGSWALERRERHLAALRALVASSWPADEAWRSPPLAGEGAVASVLGVMHTHIVTGRRGPLIELLGPLTGLVAALYLPTGTVVREIERGEQLAATSAASVGSSDAAGDDLSRSESDTRSSPRAADEDSSKSERNASEAWGSRFVACTSGTGRSLSFGPRPSTSIVSSSATGDATASLAGVRLAGRSSTVAAAVVSA